MLLQEIAPTQRRMLLEMLASERAGEDALFVGPHFGREDTAQALCALELSSPAGPQRIVLTELGRHVAEAFARRLVWNDSRAGLV